MYKYLEVDLNNDSKKQDEEMIESSLPTLQLLFRKNRVTSIPSILFMSEALSEFYEKTEMFGRENVIARVKIVDVLEKVKDKLSVYSDDYYKNERYVSYLYDYFKNKKMIKLETEEGKMPRKKSVFELYIRITPIGIESLLNLEKKDFSSELKKGFEKYKERYVNELSFVKPENIQYIQKDSENIKNALNKIFDTHEDELRSFYKNTYSKALERVEAYMNMSSDEQYNFRMSRSNQEMAVFISKITTHDRKTGKRIFRDESYVDNFINTVIDARLKEDRQEFVWKTALKTATVMKGRDYSMESSIGEGLFSWVVKFVLEDGSKFTLRTQLVWVMNDYGTTFLRKPSTFHDVYNTNGEKLKSPSHEDLVKYL